MQTNSRAFHEPELWKTHDKKVKPYLWSHRAVGISRGILGLLYLALLLFTPEGVSLQHAIDARTELPFVRWLFYFAVVAGLWAILSFPFSALQYVIERRYGLSRQRFGSWLWDGVKGALVGAILGGLVLLLLFIALTKFPNSWWLIACVFLLCFSILLAQLAPVVLIPLFFKLKPMDPGALKDRLLRLCTNFKVDVKDVYHLGLGEKTEKGNAAFVGLGRTKRILIGDTLYEKFTEDEVEAVFAHELGHQIHNDLWKGIGLSAVILFVSFYLAYLLCPWALSYFQVELIQPMGIFIFFLLLSLIQAPLGVLQVVFSRAREWAADRFAAEKANAANKLAEALEKLTLQNWGLFRPNFFMEFFTHSHPSPARRIGALRGK